MAITRYTTSNGRIVKQNRNGEIRGLISDTLGSVIKMVDEDGAVTDIRTYWPYGETRTSTGNTVTPWGFVGARGYYKSSYHLTYVRARFLTTQKAAWTQLDQLWPQEKAYTYCNSSPNSNIDPTGNATIQFCRRPVYKPGFWETCLPNRQFTGPVEHWFFIMGGGDSDCQYIGWGPNGIYDDEQRNVKGYDKSKLICRTITLTDAQKKCMCDNMKAIRESNRLGYPAVLCGKTWEGPEYCITPNTQVCQTFLECLYEKCLGKSLNFDLWEPNLDGVIPPPMGYTLFPDLSFLPFPFR